MTSLVYRSDSPLSGRDLPVDLHVAAATDLGAPQEVLVEGPGRHQKGGVRQISSSDSWSRARPRATGSAARNAAVYRSPSPPPARAGTAGCRARASGRPPRRRPCSAGRVPSTWSARAGSSARPPAGRPRSGRRPGRRPRRRPRPSGGLRAGREHGAGQRAAGRPTFGIGIGRQPEDPLPVHRGASASATMTGMFRPRAGRHRRRRPQGTASCGVPVRLGQLPGPGRVAAVVAGPDHDLAAADPTLGIEEPEGQDEAELEGAAPAGGGGPTGRRSS